MAGCASGQDIPNSSALIGYPRFGLRGQDGAATFQVHSDIPNVYHPVFSKCVRNITELVNEVLLLEKLVEFNLCQSSLSSQSIQCGKPLRNCLKLTFKCCEQTTAVGRMFCSPLLSAPPGAQRNDDDFFLCIAEKQIMPQKPMFRWIIKGNEV